MIRNIRNRLSYANVVATIALFFGLGGATAWAIDEFTGANIQDGSLTNVDYKDNDIRSADVRDSNATHGGLQGVDLRDDTLTASQIDESTLDGIVPEAVSESVDPSPDPLANASGGVAISKTVNLAHPFTPVVIASLQMWSPTANSNSNTPTEAICSVWANGSQISRNQNVDFRFTADDEQISVVGQAASSFAADTDVVIQVRCSMPNGTVKFDQGTMTVLAIPG